MYMTANGRAQTEIEGRVISECTHLDAAASVCGQCILSLRYRVDQLEVALIRLLASSERVARLQPAASAHTQADADRYANWYAMINESKNVLADVSPKGIPVHGVEVS